MPSIKKYPVRFPFRRQTAIANDGVALALPGPESYGPAIDYVIADNGATVTQFLSNNGPSGTPSRATSWIQSFRIADEENHERLVGIGIAPDSAIHACNFHLTGGEVYRISPGNPLTLSHVPETAQISIPTQIPPIEVITSGEGASDTLAWDATSVLVLAGDPRVDTPVWTWPLIIEAYYGAIPQRAARAPYQAHVNLSVEATDDGVTSSIHFCIDGRKRMRVTVVPTTAGSTLSGVGMMGISNFIDDASPELDVATETNTFLSESDALNASEANVFEFGTFSGPAGTSPNQIVMPRGPLCVFTLFTPGAMACDYQFFLEAWDE